MFDSIIFDLNPYFGYNTVYILCEFAMLLDRYIYCSLRRGGTLFFLWEQMYISGSAFIKKIKPFACHYISMPR